MPSDDKASVPVVLSSLLGIHTHMVGSWDIREQKMETCMLLQYVSYIKCWGEVQTREADVG